jgi:hypothetical protein
MRLCCLFSAVLFAALSAHAQGNANNVDVARDGETVTGDTRVVDINEVERGLFLSVDYGVTYFIPLKQPDFIVLNPDYTLPGTRMGLRLGYDILNNVAVDAFVLGIFNEGLIDTDSTGDIANLAVGVGARFSFITTERTFVNARLGVGYGFWLPKELANNALGSIHTDLTIGVDHHTLLRHVSVGIEVGVQALLLPMAIGIHAYPVLKYTF